LWLDACRRVPAGKALVEGLHLFVPRRSSSLVRERMANLNRAAAKWSLFEFDERHDAVAEIDCSDRGNVATRMVHAPNEASALERFAESIDVDVWAAVKKSLEPADGYQGFLFLLVVQSLIGSYIAWYPTHYVLFWMLPDSIRLSAWYGWIALFVAALASAAVQPPMFIGFSLLAEASQNSSRDGDERS
jgi:hypothetical protein